MSTSPHEPPPPLTPADLAHLETLLVEWRGRLLGTALRFLRDEAAAEDVVQEATRRLLERPPGGRTLRAFSAFLFTTIRHLSLDALRDRKLDAKTAAVAAARARRAEARLERGDPVVEQAALADTLRAVIARTVTLTELERRAVLLVHFDHLSTTIAALRLGTRTKSIDRALRRAYPKLGAVLLASADPQVDGFALASLLEGPSDTPRASMEADDIDHPTPRDEAAA